MMFTKEDVGQPAGKNAKRLTDTQRQAIADEWNDNLQDVREREELALIPELRESILDQIAMGETPDPDKRSEYKRLRQKHPRIAGEESAPLPDGAFTR